MHKKRHLFVVALVFTALALTAPAFADCPIGTHPWLDSRGNEICKEFGANGRTVPIEPGPGGACPNGTRPWTDDWGNRICKELGTGGRSFHDTARGCPNGTRPWTDIWGDLICKRF